jgi:prepilin signal peptidase PulO-like enzyme (type II secretory pathway)
MGGLRGGDVTAGLAGAALLASLFLDWYSGLSAWEAFSVLDAVLALLALVPFGLVATQATRDSPSLPVFLSVLTTVAGLLAALLILYRIVNQPGPNDVVVVHLGAWAGFSAAAVLTAGGWWSMRDESMPGVPAPPVEDLPAPAP